MHYSDLIIISFLFFWSFRGFIKGFISELISLLSWATAIYIFIYNFELPLYYIENIIGTSQISSILTIFIIILATYIFSAIIGFFLSKLVLLIGFSTFNKVFGLLFGFL